MSIHAVVKAVASLIYFREQSSYFDTEARKRAVDRFFGCGKTIATTTVVTIGIRNSDSSIWPSVLSSRRSLLLEEEHHRREGGPNSWRRYRYGLSVCRQRNRRRSSVLSVSYSSFLRRDSPILSSTHAEFKISRGMLAAGGWRCRG